MTTFSPGAIVAAGLAACLASAAVAQEVPVAGPVSPVAGPVSDAVAGRAADANLTGNAPRAFSGSSAMAEAELGAVAGRENTGALVASAAQRNTVANNSVTGTSTTGNVQIDGNAFQNLQGLAVISANSGNNVAINSAMNVVVNLAPR